MGANDELLAVEVDAAAVAIAGGAVISCFFAVFEPVGVDVAAEEVDAATVDGGVVEGGTDGHAEAGQFVGDGNGGAEIVAEGAIAGGEFLLLVPDASDADEDVGCTCSESGGVVKRGAKDDGVA